MNKQDFDYTASMYALRGSKLLLLRHKKTGLILPPGGHIEGDELPHEAAVRECIEETGYEPELASKTYSNGSMDIQPPFHVNMHEIKDNHWHYDFAFLSMNVKRISSAQQQENSDVFWVAIDKVNSHENIPKNVKVAAEKALLKTSQNR